MDDFRNFTFDEIVVGPEKKIRTGIVLGARVPIVLTSRVDPVRMRLVSTAVMMLVVHSRRLAARPLV